MKNIFLLLLTCCILLISCQATKNNKTPIAIQKAHWYNWSGGQPGIGGTNYEIHITGIEDGQEVAFESLILDGEKINIDKINEEGKKYILYFSENKSNRNEDVVGGKPAAKPDFRKKDPETAILTGTYKGDPFELKINNFEEQPNKKYP